jgi:probable HAF family extracellular repeat protein
VTTQAFGINDQGLVVGDYYRADGVPHGFVWRRGRFTTVDGPLGTGATLTDLDDRGRIIGLSSSDPANPGTSAGFQLQQRRYSTFAVPGAPLTFPLAVNNRGQIVGFSALRFALEEDSDTRGFVLRNGAGGPLTRIDVPGAFGSGATGINDHGTIVGLYGNPDAAQGPYSASACADGHADDRLTTHGRLAWARHHAVARPLAGLEQPARPVGALTTPQPGTQDPWRCAPTVRSV